jgi:hypothetical protein
MSTFEIEWDWTSLPMSPSECEMIFGAAERRWGFVITDWPLNAQQQPALDVMQIKVEMDDLNRDGESADGFTVARLKVLEWLPASSGPAAGLPNSCLMLLDRVQFPLALTERGPVVRDLIAHEIGHALGFGTSSRFESLVQDGNAKKFFRGARALEEYRKLAPGSTGVPIEIHGDANTASKHWDEHENDRSQLGRTMLYELMSGTMQNGDNRLSPLTVAAMGDLGYKVDIAAAESYRIAD